MVSAGTVVTYFKHCVCITFCQIFHMLDEAMKCSLDYISLSVQMCFSFRINYIDSFMTDAFGLKFYLKTYQQRLSLLTTSRQ